jgi:hypothetical protein
VSSFKDAIQSMKFSDTGSIFPDDQVKNPTTLLMLLTLLSYPATETMNKERVKWEDSDKDKWYDKLGSCLYHTALFTTAATGSGPKGAYFNDRVAGSPSGSPNSGFFSLYDKCAQVMPAMGDFFNSVAEAVSNWLKNNSFSVNSPTDPQAAKTFIYTTFFSPQSFGGAFLCYKPTPTNATEVTVDSGGNMTPLTPDFTFSKLCP